MNYCDKSHLYTVEAGLIKFWCWCLLGCSFILPIQVVAADLPTGFTEVLVADNLDPVSMTCAPDGRIFIAEKNGRILIVEDGVLRSAPFLVLEVDNYNERGISGITLHPDFTNNGYVYLYYTVKGADHNRISRFVADGNFAVPESEQVLLDLDTLRGSVHNGGAMAFGPDGKLYVSVGDGANAQAAQDFTSLLGKILRLNGDGTIPDDNPFYNETTGIYRAIYSLGLRNPFSMSIQPGTGRMFATEVGNYSWEEVNEILPAMNYGWPVIEGPLDGQTPPENYMDPAFVYSHDFGCAAVGAAFYNPVDYLYPPEYHGQFFFADYCNGYIKYMDPDVPGVAHTFATNINRPLNLLVTPDGTMYYLARAGVGGGSEEDNTATTDGTLWRIIYTGSGAPFVAVDPKSTLIPEGEDAVFTTTVSGTHPLFYQWQRDGTDIQDATSSSYLLASAMLSDSGSMFRCIITNLFGADTTQSAELQVTSNHRPDVQISIPQEGDRYRAGDVLQFSGSALDPEEGQLDPSALRWRIDFHHNSHTHPALAPTAGIASGEYYIPQIGETSDNVWYSVYLSATDSAGLSRTVSREIYPVRTQFRVETEPPNLPVFVESDYIHAPVTITSVVGIIRRLEAVKSFVESDSIRIFKKWSNGVTDHVLAFAAEEDTLTYTAIYETFPVGKGSGVRGFYYDGPPFDPAFYEPFAFSRIDPEIDFDWGEESPSFNSLGNDFWLVRWEGYIEPFVDDEYTFHIVSDDGARLWVGDKLIVDAWVDQPPTEWTGTIPLSQGQAYPLRLEYYEAAGGALCQLSWSTERLNKHIVSRTQLYPEAPVGTVTPEMPPVQIYPNPANQILNVRIPEFRDHEVGAEIRNTLGQLCYSSDLALINGGGQIDVRSLAPGVYWIWCFTTDKEIGVAAFVKE